MTIKTICLPVQQADIIIANCDKYGCDLVRKGPAGKNPYTLKAYSNVTVSGSDESVKKLFELVEDGTELAK